MKKIFFFLLLTDLFLFAQESVINTSHLDFLYEDISVNGQELGIIHIYSDYPYDKWTGDDDEGIACIDDAARAAVFYMKYYEYTKDSSALDKAVKLIRFVLYMQADNGFFYNFIWDDHSINKTHQNSVADPNWWSWRAIWCLAEAYDHFKEMDISFNAKIKESLTAAIEVTLKWLPDNKTYTEIGGFKQPEWLPYQTAADQAAILVLGLVKYSASTRDTTLYKEIKLLCDGILQMQAGSRRIFPYYAFLSWQNTWHAWGNNQASAVISAGDLLENKSYLEAGINEVNYFYPYLIQNGYMSNFSVEKSSDSVIIKDSSKFSQIAYGIRPLVFASLMAYEKTDNEQYAKIAGELIRWFFGDNPAGKQMYSSETGRCFDGINNENDINRNSGAESTIEALLALLEAELLIIKKRIFFSCQYINL